MILQMTHVLRPRPFLKWAGGKGCLLDQLEPLLPTPEVLRNRSYEEPFLGGGAMFFRLHRRVRACFLSDVNADLMNAYDWVKRDVEGLIVTLRALEASFHSDREFFYDIRESFNAGDCQGIDRAAAMIFLNRTCFNGLWRVNRKGKFNCPVGRPANRQKTVVVDEDNLIAVHQAFTERAVFLHAGPWNKITLGDGTKESSFFWYFDPPYDGTYDGYSAGGFGETDQLALANRCREIDRAGGLFMASNADTPLVRQIYDGFDIRVVRQRVSVNGDGEGRGEIGDLVIRNYGGAQ